MEIVYLLFILMFGHFIGDFVLPNKSILKAKQFGKPILGFVGHSLHHSTIVGFIVLFVWIYYQNKSISFGKNLPIDLFSFLFLCIGFQFILHFLIDYSKSYLNRNIEIFKSPESKWYWVLFGFDQFLHFCTHLVLCLLFKYFVLDLIFLK